MFNSKKILSLFLSSLILGNFLNFQVVCSAVEYDNILLEEDLENIETETICGVIGSYNSDSNNSTSTCGDFVVYSKAGTGYSYSDGVLTINGSGEYTVRMADGVSQTDNTIEINSSGNVYLTIDNVNISEVNSAPIHILDNATLYLTLRNSNVLDAHDTDNYAGIQLSNNSSLVVTEESYDAVLDVIGGENAAGIGTGKIQRNDNFVNVNSICINGGKINVQGGDYGSGIGTGYVNVNDTQIKINKISVSGGTVNAIGGSNSAGIGTGYTEQKGTSMIGTIQISGGTVNASGKNNGSGIGVGDTGEEATSVVENIVVSGGIVKSSGNKAFSKSLDVSEYTNLAVYAGDDENSLAEISDLEGSDPYVSKCVLLTSSYDESSLSGLRGYYGNKLESIKLPSGWTWEDGSVSLGEVGTKTFTAVFNNGVGDSQNKSVSVAVVYEYIEPENLMAVYGQKLSEIVLPDGWTWDDGTQDVGDAGRKQFEAVFNDGDAHVETKSLFVDVSVDKSSWGTAVDNGGIVNYVSEDGTTSAEITGNHMIYLKEESDGTSAWYAIDNSEGVFRSGSKLHVRWLNANENPEEMDKYYDMLDEKYRNASEQEKLWIFLVGVTDPDGEEYRQFEKSVPFYIELGEDWDKDDIKAVFISSESDEVLDVEYIDDFETPEGIRSVAKLTMHHFSPYAIIFSGNYDKAVHNHFYPYCAV